MQMIELLPFQGVSVSFYFPRALPWAIGKLPFQGVYAGGIFADNRLFYYLFSAMIDIDAFVHLAVSYSPALQVIAVAG